MWVYITNFNKHDEFLFFIVFLIDLGHIFTSWIATKIDISYWYTISRVVFHMSQNLQKWGNLLLFICVSYFGILNSFNTCNKNVRNSSCVLCILQYMKWSWKKQKNNQICVIHITYLLIISTFQNCLDFEKMSLIVKAILILIECIIGIECNFVHFGKNWY